MEHLQLVTLDAEILAGVLKIASSYYNLEPDKIDPAVDVELRYGGDSLYFMQFVMEVEETFQIRIPDDHNEALRTIDALAREISWCRSNSLSTSAQ